MILLLYSLFDYILTLPEMLGYFRKENLEIFSIFLQLRIDHVMVDIIALDCFAKLF